MKLIKYEAARHALAEARSVDEVKGIRDKAEAMRAYAKQTKDYDMANWAAEIRIRAERKMGEMLMAQKDAWEMNKGTVGQLTGERDATGGRIVRPPVYIALKLADMGITKSMSSRAQAIASVPEEEFEQAISEHKDQQKELTSATIHSLTEKGKAHVAHNSGENEWYTPIDLIDAAKPVSREAFLIILTQIHVIDHRNG